MHMERHHYAEHFGPTIGDKIRLGDTELFAEIEKDHTVYGDEAIFGGGKVLRDGMGQSPVATRGQGTPDVVITNVVIVDYTGIVKADVAIRDGRITGIGKSGNPGIMDGVTLGMEVGVSTEIIAGEGMILTAGAIDAHVHFISPNQIPEAFYSGIISGTPSMTSSALRIVRPKAMTSVTERPSLIASSSSEVIKATASG